MSQIVGAFWYVLAIDRNDSCWKDACHGNSTCSSKFLYCGNQDIQGFDSWAGIRDNLLQQACPPEGEAFDFGIFKNVLSSGVASSTKFFSKYCYCLWWGLQNLRCKFSLSLCWVSLSLSLSVYVSIAVQRHMFVLLWTFNFYTCRGCAVSSFFECDILFFSMII